MQDKSRCMHALMVAVCLMCLPAILAAAPATRPASRPYKASAGPHAVAIKDLDWRDEMRQRTLPVRIYSPKDLAELDRPAPVIIFSHGLGGSRLGYAYLGQHWASYGYVSVHLQHPGSDQSVWQGKANPMDEMRRAAANPANAIDRPMDVRFAVDQIEKLNADDGPYKGTLNLKAIGMAGHSFGAYTTLAASGQVFITPAGKQLQLAEPRIKAAIEMSAPVLARKDQYEAAYAKIAIPILHMTGTEDTSSIGNTTAEQRRIPFDHIKAGEQYLLTFDGGDHMVFSGRGRAGGLFGGQASGKNDALFQNLILQSTTAFWDACLREDAEAKAWLKESFAPTVGKAGKVEIRSAAR